MMDLLCMSGTNSSAAAAPAISILVCLGIPHGFSTILLWPTGCRAEELTNILMVKALEALSALTIY
jgi:hypothetical protein